MPWDLVMGLTPHLRRGTSTSVDEFSAGVVARMPVAPVVRGTEYLPESARFVLAANHYQRKGLWILHAAAAITQAIRHNYGPGDPPVRWIVTANWPAWRIGRWRFASPGDRLLPRVAHALCCYPVSFAAHNPGFTAASLRRVLREARTLDRPLGIFPEGVAGTADYLAPALPGVGRLLQHLVQLGLPVVPCRVAENGTGLVLNFGDPLDATALLHSSDAGQAVIDAIRRTGS
jgi:hypothetical protein